MRICHFIAVVLVGLWTSARGQDDLAKRIDALIAKSPYSSARWGVLVVDAQSDIVVLERNADQLFRPASVTKLFSTAAALVELGAESRFETPVVRRGEVDSSGTLKGDLILIAKGDPSLGGRTGPNGQLLFQDNDHSYANPKSRSTIVPADPFAGLDHLAREVHASGIRAIEGDVIIDDRLFDHAASTGSGPSRVTPILINDNVIDIEVTPGAKPGEPALARALPPTSFVAMDSVVETGPAGSDKYITVHSIGPRRFQVRGSIPAGASPSYHIYEIEDPASFARAAFIEQLRARGVKTQASPLGENHAASLPDSTQTASLPRVAQYRSPPFREYARVILKVSQNLHASMLPLLLAVHRGQRTLEEGLAIEGSVLKSLGVDVGTISFGGGAGGSPSDLVTPRATVALLRGMAKRPDFAAFSDALPVLGRDGTLAQAVPEESPARGHVRAKTGTFYVPDRLTGKTILTSKALAGYMETASGRSLILVIFLNDIPIVVENGDISEATAKAGRLLGRICEAIYDDATPSTDTKNEAP